MLSLLEVVYNSAVLCNGIYEYPGSKPIEWNFIDRGNNQNNIFWAIYRENAVDYVIFRGTSNLTDVEHDLNFFYDLSTSTPMGKVHPGAYEGMNDIFTEIEKLLFNPVTVFAGHSYGALHANMGAGISVLKNKKVNYKVVFGEPRPGDAEFGKYVSVISTISVANYYTDGHDPITDIPPSWVADYRHPTPFFKVNRKPDANDPWFNFAGHHMQYYLDAIKKVSLDELNSFMTYQEVAVKNQYENGVVTWL
jgi:Lipase (class 3)